MVGMASALGCRVAHVDLHGIVDARRRLQMPMLSVEWVTLSYSVDTDVNAADELYGTGFIRAFAEGITAAGVILPGLDLLTITDNGLATGIKGPRSPMSRRNTVLSLSVCAGSEDIRGSFQPAT